MDGQGAQIELPRYRSRKEVWALRIAAIEKLEDGTALITPTDERYAPFAVPEEYVAKHDPQVGGYYVQYRDGYRSWSPQLAFEEGYTLLTPELLDAERKAVDQISELKAEIADLNALLERGPVPVRPSDEAMVSICLLDPEENFLRHHTMPLKDRAYRIVVDGMAYDQCRVEGDVWSYKAHGRPASSGPSDEKPSDGG